MTKSELMWLAGLLEGEGSFLKGPPSKPNAPIVCVQMTDEDVVLRAANLFGTSVVRNKQDGRGDWKPTFSARVRGLRAVELMKKLRPHMGRRRQTQIDNAIGSYRDLSRTILGQKEAAEIRRRSVAGEKMSQLAEEFGVSYCTVKKIKYGETWKNAG